MSATAPSTAPVAPPSSDDGKLDRGLLLVASVVVLGAVMSILDTTVVNVAINTLARDFHTSRRRSSGSRPATRWRWRP